MTARSTLRDLRSVMLVTLHVAVIAYAIRVLGRPTTLAGSFAMAPVVIGLAVLITWPIGRMVTSAFDPADVPDGPACPRCGLREIRPLIRRGGGLFQTPAGYRCAACWTTYREIGGPAVDGRAGAVDPSGIAFLDDPADGGGIRFLDDPPGSPDGA